MLTLWAAVVAERLGFAADEALTLGRALAGLTAQAKGVRLGIFEPASAAEISRQREATEAGAELKVHLMGRTLTMMREEDGLRARSKGAAIEPESVRRYLASKFGDALDPATRAMRELAASRPPAALAREAFGLYERFRPAVDPDARGWGQRGVLDLAKITHAADEG